MKEKLKKINDYVWELDEKARERMRVGCRIIGNQKIVDGIEDEAIKQLTNVACLPGVLYPVVGLSDMHWGYGLPMGAVAGFDSEEGIISAGLAGFDINCISGDSKVLHEFGYNKSIKDFDKTWTKDRIKCVNPHLKVKDTDINLFLRFKPKSKVYEVKTLSGKNIKATGDHPFFTEKGMVKLCEIKDEKISIFPFEGVEYEEPSDKVIISEDNIENKYVKAELKKRGLLPLSYSHEKLPYLIKLLGFIWGDGCAHPTKKGKGGRIAIYRKDKEELKEIKKDIKKLGYGISLQTRNRHHKIKTFYGGVSFDATENSLKNNSHSFFVLFKRLGLPIGDKTKNKFEIPKWLLKAPLWQKRLFLAGFFGAELTTPAVVTGHGFNIASPVFSVNKSEELIENGFKFLKQIRDMLGEFGVKSNVIKERKNYIGKKGVKYRLRLQVSSKSENLIRFWTKIGYEYSKKKKFLGNVAAYYLKMKEQVLDERRVSINKAEILKEMGLKPREIYKKLKSLYVNKRFLERSLFEGRKTDVRIAFNFVKFGEFIKDYTKGLGETGQVWDQIIDKKEIDFDKEVYDFTVDDENHNFIANSFVVSNCGVNSIRTNLGFKEVKEKQDELVKELFMNIPCGVGSKGKLRVRGNDFDQVLERGVNWAVENGYGVKKDIENMEENGCMKGADASKVSELARKRGASQLGTLGAGNHFLEIQKVSDVYDKRVADRWGVVDKNQVLIMLHCGSRGFGHQVATDYLKIQENAVKKYKIWLPDPQLACAPVNSPEGQDFFKAMKCAVNYSFTNRLVMTQWIRETFEKVFGRDWESMDMHTVYSVAHNVIKLEKHKIGGEMKDVYVHRKGATRAFPDIPVLIAGTMGTASYLMLGTEKAMELSFGSSVHGAGRCMSRGKAIHSFRGLDVQRKLAEKGISSKATSPKVLAEESPDAYKDVEEVIKSVDGAG
ncbi:MAG: RtcB family protein, partial [Nanoarchaeota archaeon]|nr:RtcB family protein [Nanoarchaeota archaeon]